MAKKFYSSDELDYLSSNVYNQNEYSPKKEYLDTSFKAKQNAKSESMQEQSEFDWSKSKTKGKLKLKTPIEKNDYTDLITNKAIEVGLDPNFAHQFIKQESGFNPKAKSKAGALGLTQLMPETAKELGVDPNDTEQNIDGGLRYMKKMYDKYGNYEDALRAYNWGPGNMDSYLKTKKGVKGQSMPEETINHVKSIMSNFTI